MIDRRRLMFTVAAAASLAATGQALGQAMPGLMPPPTGDAAVDSLNSWMGRVFLELVLTSPEGLTSFGFDKGPMAAAKSKLDDRSQTKIDADEVKFDAFMVELKAMDRAKLKVSPACFLLGRLNSALRQLAEISALEMLPTGTS